MQHFVVSPAAIAGTTVAFSPAQWRQMARVLRLRDGDTVVVLDGQGAQYVVRLAVAGGRVEGEILAPASVCHEPRLRVTLLVAPPRGERWEWLLQKGTEIGVARFAPVVARYSQPGTAMVKPRHREIVREATEQCRRLLLPQINEPQPLAQALAASAGPDDTTTVLLWEGAAEPHLTAALRPALARGVAGVHLVIGPEGGFHADEVALARKVGVTIASLGPLILRSETAGLVAATIALSLDGTTDPPPIST